MDKRNEISSAEAELELQLKTKLGECPVWDEREEMLYLVDILEGVLYRYSPASGSIERYAVGEHVGSFALRRDGGTILALKSGFAFYDFENRRVTHLNDPEANLPNHRFNDGKCDPAGRFWAGTLSYDQQPGAGNLYCINADLGVTLKLRNLTIPNGMAWDTGRNRFYFIDSPERKIFAFDFDPYTAAIDSRSIVGEIEYEGALPDGMTIDSEGGLWIALYNGSRVIRVDPDSGDTLYEVRLPVPRVTSCTFAGPDMDRLYITTAREHMSKDDLETYPLSGSLFKIRVPVQGIPADRFAG